MRISLVPKSLKVQKSVRALPAHIRKSMGLALRRGAQEFVVQAKEEVPFGANSHLVQSLNHRKAGELRYEASASMNYSHAVHAGLKPGFLPNSAAVAIEAWIKAKGITPNNPLHSIRDLAWMIKRSIERKGTVANPFMDRAAETMRPRLREFLDEAMTIARSKASNI